VDKKGMSRREIKVGVGRVIVNGEARDADRHDPLEPRGATPSKGVPPDPFYRQILAAHCLDEIANSKILDPCLATRSQDARALEEAVTLGLSTRRHGYGCESCDTSYFGDKRGGRTHEVTARGWPDDHRIGSKSKTASI